MILYFTRPCFILTRKTHLAYLHSRPKLKSQNLNTLLKDYIKFNSTSNVLLLFKSLQKKTASIVDSFTLHFVLKACLIRSSETEGKQVHSVIVKLGFNTVIFVQTTLMKIYSVSGNVVDAQKVFDEVSTRNVVCWTALISCYVDNGKPYRGLKLFREMQMENTEPDEVTVTIALSACADLGALEVGEWIHGYVRRKRGFEADLCLNNALINMYVKCGDIGRARTTFDGLSRRDVTSWTSMIVGYALHGEAGEALRLFDDMKNKKDGNKKNGLVIPNEVTFIGVLMACSHAGRVEEGWRHLDSMSKKHGLKPRISHYGCMVDLLCRAGHLNEAYALIMNMPLQPNAVVWRTLHGACSLQGNIELGAKVRRRLLQLDPSYAGDDVTMSNTYASAGLWDEKMAVRARKHRRSPGCSMIELGDRVHEFVAADKNHPLWREIYEVLHSMIKNTKVSDYVPDIANTAISGSMGN